MTGSNRWFQAFEIGFLFLIPLIELMRIPIRVAGKPLEIGSFVYPVLIVALPAIVVGITLPFLIGLGLWRRSKIAYILSMIYLAFWLLSTLLAPALFVVGPVAGLMVCAGLFGRAAVWSSSSGSDQGSSDETGETSADAGPQHESADGETESSSDEDAQPDEPGPDPPQMEDDLDDDIVAELTAEDPATRRAACERLRAGLDAGTVPEAAAVDRLVSVLETDDADEVREAACDALGAAGTTVAVDVLEEHRLDTASRVSWAATRALRGASGVAGE